ncbi:Pectin lyase-like superfamily protein [Zea mays]|uniref:Pectate lyase n=2 Tax=Zea mays TaxID=4577 RepID=A0A1D6N9K4_MAIZE|nr:Pectin lyase-like superfamily protein [Zea mays]|eukprot:XP_008673345.2 uncharacterized LOC100502180 isoform X1 [Zea mays]
MASKEFLLAFLVIILHGAAATTTVHAANIIDRCWRRQPNWAANRQRLAACSVGFAGKMRQNRGPGVTAYTVTDPGDDPVRPRPGTLRYGATVLGGKVWITFERGMHIRLAQPLFVRSFTAIDGRGADVHIAGGAGIVLHEVSGVIIHGLHIHDIRSQPEGPAVRPGGAVRPAGGGGGSGSGTDGDAIRVVASSKVWIDHNSLSRCEDGLVDVTVGSNDVTVSNNWFFNHDKVMLLGHDDGHAADSRMRVTVAFNRFGPNVNQRMPRIRHGYAHVVNNVYLGWRDYAIGGSMGPSVKSEGNLFVASGTAENRKVTRRMPFAGRDWDWASVGDSFENGAFFKQTGSRVQPNYNKHQAFAAASSNQVRSLTKDAGALSCSVGSAC